VNESGSRPTIEVMVVDAFPGQLSIFIPPRIGVISVVVRFGTTKERNPERGAAAVEFALVLPLLCLTLFGSIDMGRMMFCRQQLAYVGAEGTRTASVLSTSTETDVKTHMIAAAPMLGLQQSDIVVTNTTSSARGYVNRAMGDTLQIQTSYTFDPWFPFFSKLLKKTWVSTLTTPAQ
jgi:Flp pilus assembly protein TadG